MKFFVGVVVNLKTEFLSQKSRHSFNVGVVRFMLREVAMQYHLKDVPRELFQQFRSKLVADNISIRDVFS